MRSSILSIYFSLTLVDLLFVVFTNFKWDLCFELSAYVRRYLVHDYFDECILYWKSKSKQTKLRWIDDILFLVLGMWEIE